MSRQNTSRAFTLAVTTVVLSLCSLSAFSEGWRKIEFLQKPGSDTDSYTVLVLKYPGLRSCVSEVLPFFKRPVPIPGSGQIFDIGYFKTIDGCDFSTSFQLFQVLNTEDVMLIDTKHTVAYLLWVKKPGQDPYATTYIPHIRAFTPPLGWDVLDPDEFLTIDNDKENNGDHIKVWVGNNGGSQ